MASTITSFGAALSSSIAVLTDDANALLAAAQVPPPTSTPSAESLTKVADQVAHVRSAAARLSEATSSSAGVAAAVDALRALQSRSEAIVRRCDAQLVEYGSPPCPPPTAGSTPSRSADASGLQQQAVRPAPLESEAFSPTTALSQLGISNAGLSALETSSAAARSGATPGSAPTSPFAAVANAAANLASASVAATAASAASTEAGDLIGRLSSPTNRSVAPFEASPAASLPAAPTPAPASGAASGAAVRGATAQHSSARGQQEDELASPNLLSPPSFISPPKSLAYAAALPSSALPTSPGAAHPPPPPPPDARPPPRAGASGDDESDNLFPLMAPLTASEFEGAPAYLREQLGITLDKANECLGTVNDAVTDKRFLDASSDFVSHDEIASLTRLGSRTKTFVLMLLHCVRLRPITVGSAEKRYRLVGGFPK